MAKRLQRGYRDHGRLARSFYAVLWLAFEPRGFGWHGAATIATQFMTLFIQRSEHRDTQAIHAKLDELLRAAMS
jgi:hypothetical protein